MDVETKTKEIDSLENGITAQEDENSSTKPAVQGVELERASDFFTRNGLTIDSFKLAHYGRGHVEMQRPMKGRHLNMIAIGGSIGAGFFVGSGAALSQGGPGNMFIDFLIIGIMMFNVVHALGELAVMYPVSGAFYIYITRFIDPSLGFALGWNYVMQWAVTLAVELTACGLTIQYWNQDVSVGVWISVFLIALIIINIFGTLGYAEEEFFSACFKLCATAIFMVICLVLVLGGGPKDGRYDEYWGARLWYNPGAFQNGFKGFCAVFVNAAFAFSGTELVGLAAAESQNPAKTVPAATKQVFWRITLFFILALFFVGLLIDPNDPSLLSPTSLADVNTSPFVLISKYAGLHGLDHFMNLTILVAVLSIGASSIYGGSRTLTSMAQQSYAPEMFTYIDKAGRPLWSVVAIILCGLLSFISLSSSGSTVFVWLQALSGLSAVFTWASVCWAHIRFRKAWFYQGHTLDEIPFQAFGGVYGSWLGLFLCAVVLAGQFYTAVAAAIGQSGVGTAEGFFQVYLAAPIVLGFWIFGFLWKRSGWVPVEKIDVDTARREVDWDELNATRAKVAAWPAWRRGFYHLFW